MTFKGKKIWSKWIVHLKPLDLSATFFPSVKHSSVIFFLVFKIELIFPVSTCAKYSKRILSCVRIFYHFSFVAWPVSLSCGRVSQSHFHMQLQKLDQVWLVWSVFWFLFMQERRTMIIAQLGVCLRVNPYP